MASERDYFTCLFKSSCYFLNPNQHILFNFLDFQLFILIISILIVHKQNCGAILLEAIETSYHGLSSEVWYQCCSSTGSAFNTHMWVPFRNLVTWSAHPRSCQLWDGRPPKPSVFITWKLFTPSCKAKAFVYVPLRFHSSFAASESCLPFWLYSNTFIL